MKRRGDTKIPEFQSLREEREYWEVRGPLAKGHKGRVNKPEVGQKRSSFLVVRLTGEELTRLRDMAAQQGLGASTLARLILTSATKHQGELPRRITLDQLKDALEKKLPQSVKDKAEALAKAMAIGDPDSPALLFTDASNVKQAEELTWSLVMVLLSMAGVQVITPEDEKYEEVKAIVKAN